MYTIRISDTYCVVTDETTGHQADKIRYTDCIGGSIEALEEAEKLCRTLNQEGFSDE
jgi:hypothetical protein